MGRLSLLVYLIQGEWVVPITVERDPRFPTKNMGNIRLITVANGFNELLMFNVPVNEHGNVGMRQVEPNKRNEPIFINAIYIHRFTIFESLDYYAAKLRLKRQKQVDPHSLQWGPETSINESKYGYTIALNGIVYGFTNEEVPIETILIKIGEGLRVISPKVEKDGDIGCHGRSECKSPIGRVFYSVRGISPNEAIAVKTNSTFFKCIKIGKL